MFLHAMSSNFAWSRNNAEYHRLSLLFQIENLSCRFVSWIKYIMLTDGFLSIFLLSFAEQRAAACQIPVCYHTAHNHFRPGHSSIVP